MSAQDDFDIFLSQLRPVPAPEWLVALAREAGQAVQAAQVLKASNAVEAALLAQESQTRAVLQPFPQVPVEPSPILPISQLLGPDEVVGPMAQQEQLLPGTTSPIGSLGAFFSVVDGLESDPKGVYPWPCGRTVSQADFNSRLRNTKAIIDSQIPLLDRHGPYASKEACQQIIQTLLINPGAGVTALKAARGLLAPTSGVRARLGVLIQCGQTLEDFEPFVRGMSAALAGMSETGDTPPTEYPCEVATGKLAMMVAQNPAQVGVLLARMAAQITPSNRTSRKLLRELDSISEMLLGFGSMPGPVPLPGVSTVPEALTRRILDLYGSIVNGSFCECPEPGTGPLI